MAHNFILNEVFALTLNLQNKIFYSLNLQSGVSFRTDISDPRKVKSINRKFNSDDFLNKEIDLEAFQLRDF